jgi:hypothetical protein
MKKTVLSIFALFLVTSALAQGLSTTPNQPIGEGKGIFPGRVVWAMNPEVSKWDGATGRWWDEGNIDMELLENMYEKSICVLAGSDNVRKAWDKIFKYHNKTHGRGNRGYRQGETIAVKINLNNTFDTDDNDNDIDQSPQATIALLRQLTKKAGVPENCIVIYDATIGWKPRAIPDRLYKPIHKLFPKVRWMSAKGSEGVEPANWVQNAISYTDSTVSLGTVLPRAVVDADYLINAALLKGHEITGVTLCAKNHFGSIPFPAKMHGSTTVSQMNGREGDYSAYVDLMGSPNLGKKTLLYIVDGLYGMQTNVGAPKPDRDKWKTLGNQWSSSLFMSLDPVAIECVCLDFLYAEFGNELGFSGAPQFPKGSSRNCDNYLKEAARGKNDRLGDYRPNGVKTGSLGVFEHWNNARDRQYSRNFGKSEGIELVTIK